MGRIDDKLGTEYAKKIDLNSEYRNPRQFQHLPGFYPTLASKIVRNAPYQKVEDILMIPGLSESEKQKLQDNLDKFTITSPSVELIEDDDRINPGL